MKLEQCRYGTAPGSAHFGLSTNPEFAFLVRGDRWIGKRSLQLLPAHLGALRREARINVSVRALWTLSERDGGNSRSSEDWQNDERCSPEPPTVAERYFFVSHSLRLSGLSLWSSPDGSCVDL